MNAGTWRPITQPEADLLRTFGAALRQARRAKGLSLRGTARRADMSPGYLCELEHGRRRPRAGTVLDLAQVLDADPARLLAAVGDALAPPSRWPEHRQAQRERRAASARRTWPW